MGVPNVYYLDEKILDDDDAYDEDFSPGRILDTRYGIMERTYDIEARRILLKFHREKGQVLFILKISRHNQLHF